MQGTAAASSSPAAPYGAWAYVVVFALMALSLAGIPAIGATVVGWAAVLAGQDKLNIVAVLVVAMLGAEAGGLAGMPSVTGGAASSWSGLDAGGSGCSKPSPRRRPSTPSGGAWPSSSPRPWSPASCG